MPLWIAVLVLAALVVATAAIGWTLRRRESRPRAIGTVGFEGVTTEQRGDRATLVQFSTEFCARCPQVRRMLRALADDIHGVTHAEVDLTHRPELATRLHILQTPTVFVLDATGAVRSRFTGVPRRDAVATEVDRVITEASHA